MTVLYGDMQLKMTHGLILNGARELCLVAKVQESGQRWSNGYGKLGHDRALPSTKLVRSVDSNSRDAIVKQQLDEVENDTIQKIINVNESFIPTLSSSLFSLASFDL